MRTGARAGRIASALGRIAGRGAPPRPALPAGLLGVVDGVVDGELRGWIADFAALERRETIVCRGRSGQALSFIATRRRDDACAYFGVDGVRAFAVPQDLLVELGPAFSVHDRSGRLLRNGRSVSLPRGGDEARSASGDRPRWLVMHIPKTAGTSFRNALATAASPGEALFVYPDHGLGVTYEDLLAMPPPQRARFRWICGHTYFGLHHRLAVPARYVTFVREPLDRLRSNVAHHVAAGTVFRSGGDALGLAEVVNGGLTDEFDNMMVRMIAGVTLEAAGPGRIREDHVDLAIDNIRRDFEFVGHQGRMEADAAALMTRMGLPVVPSGRDNVTAAGDRVGAGGKATVDRATIDWTAVQRQNRFDTLLHDRIERLGLTSRVLGP